MTDCLDLLPRYREELEALLRKHVPEAVVWAYGSRVNGLSHDGSDLDLVLRGPNLETLGNEYVELVEALEQSNIPNLVQVHDWARLPESFHREIERDYVVVQQVDPQTATSVWREVPVSKVATAIIGGTPSRKVEQYWNGSYPWATAKDVASAGSRYLNAVQESVTDIGLAKSAAKVMPKGTVLITSRGTVGALAQLGCDMAFNQTCYALQPTGDVENDYLYYALKCTRSSMYALTYGTVFQTITTKSFDEWQIPLPPLPEQRRIAHILGTLDDKIELNRRVNETLEAMARAIFQDWFVDFGPVRAKLEGREPYLPPELWDLFPDRLVDSELGEIPEGWEVKALGDCIVVVGGTTPSTKRADYWEDGTHCWATPKDLSILRSHVIFDTERKVTDAGLAKIPSGLLPAGTLLLSSRAPIGYLAICQMPVAINQGFIAVPPGEVVSNHFLLYWCQAFHDEIVNHANGSTFLEISKSNFRKIGLATPHERVLARFDAQVQSLHERIATNEGESRALAVQRDVLLPRLMSGGLRVQGKFV